jgi:predicted ThiF/HesA family dinucleotide-utilizing enzyme
MFEFETETAGVYGSEADPVAVLRADAAGVPMLRELNNDPDIDTVLVTEGPRQNIWFASISINN